MGRKREEKKRRRRRKKEEEKKKKIQVWNSCLELWFGTLVFVSMKPICMVLFVRKPTLTLFLSMFGLGKP